MIEWGSRQPKKEMEDGFDIKPTSGDRKVVLGVRVYGFKGVLCGFVGEVGYVWKGKREIGNKKPKAVPDWRNVVGLVAGPGS